MTNKSQVMYGKYKINGYNSHSKQVGLTLKFWTLNFWCIMQLALMISYMGTIFFCTKIRLKISTIYIKFCWLSNLRISKSDCMLYPYYCAMVPSQLELECHWESFEWYWGKLKSGELLKWGAQFSTGGGGGVILIELKIALL